MAQHNQSSNNESEYQKFIDLAADYCILLENSVNFSKKDLLLKLVEILPQIYSEIVRIQGIIIDEVLNRQVVKEQDYNAVFQMLKRKIGKHDDYREVFDEDIQFVDSAVTRSIAEDLTDIYQDLKNMVAVIDYCNESEYQTIVLECRANFEAYWGQRLVNVLRAIHNVVFNEEDIEDEYFDDNSNLQLTDNKVNTEDWLITKRMNEYRNGDS